MLPSLVLPLELCPGLIMHLQTCVHVMHYEVAIDVCLQPTLGCLSYHALNRTCHLAGHCAQPACKGILQGPGSHIWYWSASLPHPERCW